MESKQTKEPKKFKLILLGNIHYEVDQKILTKVEDSSLEAMFSGRHEIEDHNGFVHVNRDYYIFKLVI